MKRIISLAIVISLLPVIRAQAYSVLTHEAISVAVLRSDGRMLCRCWEVVEQHGAVDVRMFDLFLSGSGAGMPLARSSAAISPALALRPGPCSCGLAWFWGRSRG